MVVSHFSALCLFSFLVSVVFGVLSKNTPRERLLYGAKVFAAFVGIASGARMDHVSPPP